MVILTTEIIGSGEVPNPNPNSCVFLIRGVTGGGGPVQADKIACGFRQPSGVSVVDDKIYVSDRDAFYSIPDNTAPADPSANKKKIIGWPAGPRWHQWVFTPLYHGGKFYAPYSGSIRPGGPSDVPATSEWSGAFLSWNPDGSGLAKVAGGLRSPNGAGMNDAGDMFVMDNQGSWLPGCTFMHMKPGKFYGHRQSPPQAPNWAESLPYQPPAVWIPYPAYQFAGSSNSQPVFISKGPYAGQWLAGDDTGPGLIRMALEKVDGDWQGAVFHFTNGMGNAAINRMAWGPDGTLYIGTLEHYGNWPGNGYMPFYKMTFNEGKIAFEILAIHAFKDGMELEFTEPVAAGSAPPNFQVSQWHYTRGANYGCCKDATEPRTVSAVQTSADGKRVFLKIAGLKAMDYVVAFKLNGIKAAADGAALWDNEAWYTLNNMSTLTWSPVVAIAQRPADAQDIARRLSVHASGAGRLSVGLASEGGYSAALWAMDGSLVARRGGIGPERFSLSRAGRGPGVYLLEVRQGSATLTRRIPF
jgi:hypothetical protein